MNARVPSIGSSTHRNRASGRSTPNSSPTIPHSGQSRPSTARIASSAPRSAIVTGDWSAYKSAATDPRNNGRITDPAASAAAIAAAK
jgi:hypothetical protein